MPNPITPIRRLTARLQARYRKARPGSVLILVVALLVLMALIGTAFLTTARTDRYAAQQNTHTTHIELLTKGVVNLAKAAQVADLRAAGLPRPAGDDYENWDDSQTDQFIASRIPMVLEDVCPTWEAEEPAYPEVPPPLPTGFVPDAPVPRKYFEGQIVRYPGPPALPAPPADVEYWVCTGTHVVGAADATIPAEPGFPTTSHPFWLKIGEEANPPPATGEPTDLEQQVYSRTPVWPAVSRLLVDQEFEDVRGTSIRFTDRTLVFPTSMDFAGDPKFPALRFYHSGREVANGEHPMVTVPAADTDGDGVADAFLSRLPVGTLEGLDYLAAVRVVDNNAAININTAWSTARDWNAAGLDYGQYFMIGMFRSHIGLREVLNPAAVGPEIVALNYYRFGNEFNAVLNTPESGTLAFRTQGEALESQLARRVGNPGPNGTTGRFEPYTLGDGMALGYRGGALRNPDASATRFEKALSSGGPTNALEPTTAAEFRDPAFYDGVWDRATNRGTQTFTTYKDAPTGGAPGDFPFDPDPTTQNPVWDWTSSSFIYRWFDELYNWGGYTDYAAFLPMAQWRLRMGPENGYADGQPYRSIRSLVVARNPLSNQSTVKSAAVATEYADVTVPVAAMEPYGPTATPKTSINTAGFAELWRAYWAVMAQDWAAVTTGLPSNATPFDELYYHLAFTSPPTTPGWGVGWYARPYHGMGFTAGPIPTQPPGSFPPVPLQHPARMFRSPLRGVYNTQSDPWTLGTPRLEPRQTLLLRAAIAAANTRELLDVDNDITPQDITLPSQVTGQPDLSVKIYGTEKQPYLTEIFAHTMAVTRPPRVDDPPSAAEANPNGYVAIELHNPFPFAIDLEECKIATINRQDVSRPGSAVSPRTYTQDYTTTFLDVMDRDALPGPATAVPPVAEQIILRNALSNVELDAGGQPWHKPTVIPANGYLILENYDARFPSPDPRAARHRPPSAGVIGISSFDPLDPASGRVPGDSEAPPERAQTRNFAYVANLDRILNHEFVLVRPLGTRSQNVTVAGNASTPALVYDDPDDTTIPPTAPTKRAVDMAPLDSFDFTGLRHPATEPTPRAYAWHYVRASDTAGGKAWRFVYPGRYDGAQSITATAAEQQRPRHQGTQEAATGALGWDPGMESDPWEVILDPMGGPPAGERPNPASLGASRQLTGSISMDASYPREFAVQVANTDFAGPLGTGGTVDASYPHSGFARNGDIMQVTFTGSYRIKLPAHTGAFNTPEYRRVLELNALPIDTAFAEDTDPTNDPSAADPAGTRREQIGRFCPIPTTDFAVPTRGVAEAPRMNPPNVFRLRDFERRETDVNRWAGGPPTGDYYDIAITSGPGRGQVRTVVGFDLANHELIVAQPWVDPGGTDMSRLPVAGSSYELRRASAYRWTTDLFEYLTVHNPHDDYVPNVSGGTPVSNNGAPANGTEEQAASLEGLININTAHWRVLGTLPFVDGTDDNLAFDPVTGRVVTTALPNTDGTLDNFDIARAIVYWRDGDRAAGVGGHGPFRTMFDLYRVPDVLKLSNTFMATELDDDGGDITPFGAGMDGVRYDFEEQYLLLNRLSNLITTRSDSFTNYVLVQGWRGLGTANPELVVQRRRSFMSDRSGVTDLNRDVAIHYFYNE